MSFPKTLQKLEEDPRVEEIVDERPWDAGYWVYLNYPWYNTLTETTMVREDTVKDILEGMKSVEKNPEAWHSMYPKEYPKVSTGEVND